MAVLQHQKHFTNITQSDYGSVIHILRAKKGYTNIITTKEKSSNGKHYAKYIVADNKLNKKAS